MLIGRLHILIISSVARELRLIRTKLRTWAIAMKEIFRNRSFDLVSFSSLKPVEVGGVQVKMRAFEAVVLLVVIDYVWDGGLLIEAPLIDCILREVGLDCVELAEMPSAIALAAKTALLIVMRKIGIGEFRSSPSKYILLLSAIVMIVARSLGLGELPTIH